MTNRHISLLVLVLAAALVCVACGEMGRVEQGRVVAYNKQSQSITLIRETGDKASYGVLPPVSVKAPTDPEEMGPAPAAGRLIKLDTKAQKIVVYDASADSFRVIPYTPVGEPKPAAKPVAPKVDPKAKTIALYSTADKAVITFAASDDLLAMPADTWKAGDVVRYYYKDPEQALRLMNVTRTDLSKQ